MFLRRSQPITDTDKLWQWLSWNEYSMRRKRYLSYILPPLGTVLFLWNSLLAAANAIYCYSNATLREAFDKLPLLPKFAASLQKFNTGWKHLLFSSLRYMYLGPILICAGIALVWFGIDLWQYLTHRKPLSGTPAQQAQALTNQAERVYEYRKGFGTWTIVPAAAVVTVLTAAPAVYMAIYYAKTKTAAVLQLTGILIVLLFCLFVAFWIFVLLFSLFHLMLRLCFASRSAWYYWSLYRRIDAHWEELDPEEHEKRELANPREQKASKKKEKRKREAEKRTDPYEDYAQQAASPYEEVAPAQDEPIELQEDDEVPETVPDEC